MGYSNNKDTYFNNKRIQIIKSALESNQIVIDTVNNLVTGNTYSIKDSLKSQFGCTWNSTFKAWNIPQSAYAEIKQNFGIEITLVEYKEEPKEYVMTQEDKDFFGF